jgi:hypothetical protein
MDIRFTIGLALSSVLAVVSLGAQGHSGAPPGGGAHGNPHSPQGAAHGTPHTPQGPKSTSPGAGHAGSAGKGEEHGTSKHDAGAPGQMTVSQRLAAQPQLAERLQGMLPAGMTLDQAAEGFKNVGQFVAAVNVSKNLAIPFDALKAQMTGDSPKSLGQAIHTLKPDADSTAEVEKAEAQGRELTRGPN